MSASVLVEKGEVVTLCRRLVALTLALLLVVLTLLPSCRWSNGADLATVGRAVELGLLDGASLPLEPYSPMCRALWAKLLLECFDDGSDGSLASFGTADLLAVNTLRHAGVLHWSAPGLSAGGSPSDCAAPLTWAELYDSLVRTRLSGPELPLGTSPFAILVQSARLRLALSWAVGPSLMRSGSLGQAHPPAWAALAALMDTLDRVPPPPWAPAPEDTVRDYVRLMQGLLTGHSDQTEPLTQLLDLCTGPARHNLDHNAPLLLRGGSGLASSTILADVRVQLVEQRGRLAVVEAQRTVVTVGGPSARAVTHTDVLRLRWGNGAWRIYQ